MNRNITIGIIVIIIVIIGGVLFLLNVSRQSPGGLNETGGIGTVEDLAVQSPVREFNIVGSNFKFSLNEIRVKRGDTVRINFSSEAAEGILHDWRIDEFNAGTERLGDGGEETIEFVADRAGQFEYYCSVGNHRAMGMKGTLIVEE